MIIVITLVIVVGIGLAAGIGLTLASKFMAVPEDERIAKINLILPGANCGACGYAGCSDYAFSIAEENAELNLCPVGGSEIANAIGNYLGKTVEEAEKMVARMLCSGTYNKTSYVMDYRGLDTCASAKTFYKGRVACNTACQGFGDCKLVCDYDAITMSQGIAKIDESKCKSCGKCVEKCPNLLIKILPVKAKVIIACSNGDTPKRAMQRCKVACIACGKCVKECPFDAIIIENNHAIIDTTKCKNCKKCVKVCPRNSIRTL